MSTLPLEIELERETIALNRLLYDDGIGLPPPAGDWDGPTARVAALAESLLSAAEGSLRNFALETWAEARRLPLDNEVTLACDQLLVVAERTVGGQPLTWRNWKRFEREAPDEASLVGGFDDMLARSAGLVPVLEQRAAQMRADYGRFGRTPAELFAEREGTTAPALRQLLVRMGQASRLAFRRTLDEISRAVFGRAAGPAELRALYLNRMFEPCGSFFCRKGLWRSAWNNLRGWDSI